MPTASIARALLLVVLALSACVDEPIPQDLAELMRQGETYLDPQTMRPYSGPVFTRAEDDSMRVSHSGTLLDGKFDGLSESYHRLGHVSRRVQYVEGKRHGVTEGFWSNGVLESRVTFIDGKAMGPAEYRGLAGELSESGSQVDSRRCGEWVINKLGMELFLDAFPEYDNAPESLSRESAQRLPKLTEWTGDFVAALSHKEFEAYLNARFAVTESYAPCPE